jgi:hypothetical protein
MMIDLNGSEKPALATFGERAIADDRRRHRREFAT